MDIPVDAVVVVEEDAGELAGGVEVGPVDGRAAGSRRGEDKGLERRVEGGEEGEIGGFL